LKNTLLKNHFLLIILLVLISCSTKKDNFLSRNSHALLTRDNILYNGQLAFDKGLTSIKTENKDNFWKTLPVEKMQSSTEEFKEEKPKNANFEIAEAKATKAIQKHSMYIEGQEKNYQIDEAYVLLGKARYYDERFFPAIEAFNYILYKYPTSSTINPARIWREKTNMRLGNDAQVIKNVTKLLLQKRLTKQVTADANALLAESFLNLEQKDSAVAKLKIAEEYTRVKNEKARYRFILGQMYQEKKIKDTALIYYQNVINMNRTIDREYIMQAYARQAQLFDVENDDKVIFEKKYNKLIADRENKPFKGILYHEMGVFYDKNNNQKLAEKSYNASLKSPTTDDYLFVSNYRNLGDIYFKNADYALAAKYYDSTLVKLNPKTREHIRIAKVRKDLDEVIALERTAKGNDSILKVVAMTASEKMLYYEEYITKLKKSDEEKKLLDEKQKEMDINNDISGLASSDDVDMPPTRPLKAAKPATTIASSKTTTGSFYFYNPTTVAYGKVEFKKRFGNRPLKGNWKVSTTEKNVDDATEELTETNKEVASATAEKAEYKADFYIKKLPVKQIEIDSIYKERNFVYFQLGVIYKEKFKEYEAARSKLEKLLELKPEEKLVLPTLYNLYRIYQKTDLAMAEKIKAQINSQYPDSRYAQIISNKNSSAPTNSEVEEKEYNKWFNQYQQEQFINILEKIDNQIMYLNGSDIVPKYELLKANTIGKLRGSEEYKKALIHVSDNYPSSEEGKKAVQILTSEIPVLQGLKFTEAETKKWNVLYKVSNEDIKTIEKLNDTISKFLINEKNARLIKSLDIYTEKDNFIAIHGISSETRANAIVAELKENKRYNLVESGIVISSLNYEIVEIKKNLEEFLKFTKRNDVVTPTATKQEGDTGKNDLNPKAVNPKVESPIKPSVPNTPHNVPPLDATKDAAPKQ
jgi:tetratricopeptide (TPR) repeat protein